MTELVAAVDNLADRLNDYANGDGPTVDPRELAEALVFLHLEVEQAMSKLENLLTNQQTKEVE